MKRTKLWGSIALAVLSLSLVLSGCGDEGTTTNTYPYYGVDGTPVNLTELTAAIALNETGKYALVGPAVSVGSALTIPAGFTVNAYVDVELAAALTVGGTLNITKGVTLSGIATANKLIIGSPTGAADSTAANAAGTVNILAGGTIDADVEGSITFANNLASMTVPATPKALTQAALVAAASSGTPTVTDKATNAVLKLEKDSNVVLGTSLATTTDADLKALADATFTLDNIDHSTALTTANLKVREGTQVTVTGNFVPAAGTLTVDGTLDVTNGADNVDFAAITSASGSGSLLTAIDTAANLNWAKIGSIKFVQAGDLGFADDTDFIIPAGTTLELGEPVWGAGIAAISTDSAGITLTAGSSAVTLKPVVATKTLTITGPLAMVGTLKVEGGATVNGEGTLTVGVLGTLEIVGGDAGAAAGAPALVSVAVTVNGGTVSVTGGKSGAGPFNGGNATLGETGTGKKATFNRGILTVTGGEFDSAGEGGTAAVYTGNTFVPAAVTAAGTSLVSNNTGLIPGVTISTVAGSATGSTFAYANENIVVTGASS